MNYRDIIRGEISRILNVPSDAVSLERTRLPGLGDLTTNLIIRSAKGDDPTGKASAAAEKIAGSSPAIGRVTVSKPGFLNFTPSPRLANECMAEIVRGNLWPEIEVQKICVEFVSANPTGPLHVGHANGAYTGEAIAAMLEAAGHDVTREYYANDRGGQIGILGSSVFQRMLEITGAEWSIPRGGYPGEYVKDVAQVMLDEHDLAYWEVVQEDNIGYRAATLIIRGILAELSEMGIRHDSVISETALIEEGAYERMASVLEAEGATYRGTLPAPMGEPDPDWVAQETLLFRSTDMGDDMDRALERPDGNPTYFGADCAYHQNKIDRGFDRLINVLGADHAGYTARIAAFVAKSSEARIEFKMTALVKLMRGGAMETMSKRAGKYVTVSDAVREYGNEELRYFLMSRVQDDVIVLDGDAGIQRKIFGELLSALHDAEAKVADVIAAERWFDIPEDRRVDRFSLSAETPDGSLGDLRAIILETPEVMSRALRDMAPNMISDHALALSAAIRKADVVPGRENVLIFASAAAALRECLKACGTPERALEIEVPTVDVEPDADERFEV